MKRKDHFKILIMVFAISISGCMNPFQHQKNLHTSREREMTLGIVQKEIRVGMSQPDVAAALGSPNIVTKDSEGKETWIYDKIATEASFSKGSVEGLAAGGGAFGSGLVLGLISGSKQTGAASSSQKTLTVIIKYGDRQLVESFSFHASKF